MVIELEKPQQLPPITMEWLIGFIEGEGCYTIYDNTLRGRKYKKCFISITQKERAILERIKEFLGGWGHIYRYTRPHECHVLVLYGIRKLKAFALLLKGNIRSPYKNQQFEEWYAKILLIPEGRSIQEKQWTIEEDQLIMNNTDKSKKDLREILLAIGKDRTEGTIRNRIYSIGVSKPKRYKDFNPYIKKLCKPNSFQSNGAN